MLSVGDEEFQRKSFQKFLEFKEQGKTIILVTHAMPVIEQLCDQVSWINSGKLMMTGKASEVVSSYRASVDGQGG